MGDSLLDRLGRWLDSNGDLPWQARTTLENFVISCERPDLERDYRNFRHIDIRHFPPLIQERLVYGFMEVYADEVLCHQIVDYEFTRALEKLRLGEYSDEQG